MPERGVRVLVPFGPRRVVGWSTGPARRRRSALKDVLEVVDEVPLVAPPLLDLADWVAEHYLAPPGECYRLALPPAGVRASRAIVRLPKTRRRAVAIPSWSLCATARCLCRRSARAWAAIPRARWRGCGARAGRVDQDLAAPGFRQVRIAGAARGGRGRRAEGHGPGGGARPAARGRRARPVADLVRDRPSLRGALERLGRGGRHPDRRGARRPRAAPEATAPARLAVAHRATSGRPRAILPALDARRFGPFLLHGVTGSGKTEVYFRAAERALEQGRGALILVPEIALTPLLVRAAVARFGAIVSVLHSELSAGERHDQWWRIREGEARGRRRALRRLRARARPRPDRRRRGARRRLQAGREPALSRARRGGDAREAGGRGGAARLGHAVAGVVRERGDGEVPAAGLPTRIGRQGLPRSRWWTGGRC